MTNTTCDNLTEMDTNPFILTGCLLTYIALFFTYLVKVAVITNKPTTMIKSRYYDDFSELENDTLTDDDKKLFENVYINETDYNVIMSYSFTDDVFQYWGDNTIPYSILDSVAQLYAVENNCKSICVDYESEIDKSAEKLEEIMCRKEELVAEPDSAASPFACFKKYNMKTNRAAKNTSIVPEKCNHFRRKGSMNEWILTSGKWVNSFNSETAKTWANDVIENNNTTMSYTEWKSTRKL